MKKRYRSTLALIICVIMTLPALYAGIAAAEEEKPGFLGQPFPEFTAADTEGNTFTLSEALKDHEAVLINFRATWCTPCRNEFPYLNEACEKYRNRLAFFALSTEPKDTADRIEAYRKENGLISFAGAPDVYHVTIIDVPGGYNWDEDYEMYSTREYGEWALRVWKD